MNAPFYLSVDPGRATGWASWNLDGKMIACGLARHPYTAIPTRPSVLIIETPHAGKGKASKEDIETLLRRKKQVIAWVGAEHVQEIEPATWKASVPKVFTSPDGTKHYPALRHIQDKMTLLDQGIFLACMQRDKIAPSLRHNVLDSIGIGISWLHTQGLRHASTPGRRAG